MSAHIAPEKRAEIIALAHLPIFEIIKKTGTTRNTISSTLTKAGLAPPARPTNTNEQFMTYEPKPRVRVKAYNEPRYVDGPRSVPIKICVFGDTHDSVDLEQSRFDHIGRWIADVAPDYAVHMGDHADWTTFSRFEGRESIHGRDKPAFQDELDSAISAMERITTPIDTARTKLVLLAGNHEERIWNWENEHPEVEGMLWGAFEGAVCAKGWAVHPYRQWVYLGGVGFIHAPHNGANKPYQGKTAHQQIGNDAVHSVVFAHTHKPVAVQVPKMGQNNAITVFNPGCALPQGYVKPYAMLATTGWGWSVGELTIQDGRIVEHSLISMESLERRYGQ